MASIGNRSSRATAMSERHSIDLNADLGESFGRYQLGDDEALTPLVTTVSVACGYHAADPATMHESVQRARRHGVGLGAHVAYPDLAGFGRRRMHLSRQEVYQIVVHQIGGLLGFCLAEGVELQHVKPHGQLASVSQYDRETARGMVEAIRAVGRDLMLLSFGELLAQECNRAGVRMVHEGFVDLDYNAECELLVERAKQRRDAAAMARRAVTLANEQLVLTTSDTWLPVPAQSICVHGDGPNAPEIARAVRDGLVEAGYEIVGLRELPPAPSKAA